MADISSRFLGISSPNPFWLASAPPTDKEINVTRAFEAGWGGVVWKTLGEDPHVVNVNGPRYSTLMAQDRRVMGLNNIELITDRPLRTNLEEMTRVKKAWPDRALIASLMVPCVEESWKRILPMVEDTGADGLELNFGCPHGMSERGMGAAVGQVPEYIQMVTQWCKQYSRLPVIVKLTPNITDVRFPARALVGYAISALREHMPHINCRIVSILRQDKTIRPQGSTIIEAGDEVTFICATVHIKAIMSELQRLEKPYKRIMIIGGGNIAGGVAKLLEDSCTVKLIERNPERATLLAEKLSKTLVFCGDASDQSLLFEEHIENIDVFISLTSDDEANIMSALLGKRLGAKKTMVLIQRMAYINLIQGGTIDIAVSPQQATISALLGHVRKGDIANVVSLRHGIAEALEIIMHGDSATSQVIGRKISDLKLPAGAIIGAILRDHNEVIIAKKNVIIEENDHVIIYLSDKKQVPEIEKLFQPSAFYI